MTYLVTENCIKCKHTDCVSVCPVDCFYEGENFLVINPDECIDCGVCEPECPVGAIVSEIALSEKDRKTWMDINSLYSNEWPRLTEKKEPLDDHAEWDGVPNKINMLSPLPGDGDY